MFPSIPKMAVILWLRWCNSLIEVQNKLEWQEDYIPSIYISQYIPLDSHYHPMSNISIYCWLNHHIGWLNSIVFPLVSHVISMKFVSIHIQHCAHWYFTFVCNYTISSGWKLDVSNIYCYLMILHHTWGMIGFQWAQWDEFSHRSLRFGRIPDLLVAIPCAPFLARPSLGRMGNGMWIKPFTRLVVGKYQ